MTDCMNAEIRDRLPDLLNERLDSETRAAVVEHVAGCEACRQELAVLKATKGLLARVPRVDTARIASAVVAEAKASVTATAPRVPSMGRTWVSWRMAAALVLAALGGAAIVVVYSMRQQDKQASERIAERTLDSGAVVIPSPAKVPDVTTPVPQGPSTVATKPPKDSTTPVSTTRVVASTAAELSVAESESELSEGELRALLSELERVELLPAIEPEPVAVRITPRRTVGGGSTE